MVLLIGIIAGFIALLIRSKIKRKPIRVIELKYWWLVIVAFIPQVFAFYFSVGALRLPDEWIPTILVSTQIVLLLFVWLNRRLSGMWLSGVGLILNFLVIISNGGFMPISPEMVSRYLIHNETDGSWQVGKRLLSTKDIVIPPAETKLFIFSDRFAIPEWFHYPVVFSLGDVLISLGIFWLIFSSVET